MGGADFAYYLEKVGGALAFHGTGGSGEARQSKHGSAFRPDGASFYYCIMAHVLAGESL